MFWFDNTLCSTKGNLYLRSKPIKKNIEVVNKLYKKGFVIKIFTSRFMGRSNENVEKAKKKRIVDYNQATKKMENFISQINNG